MKKIQILESFRGIAALTVLFHHVFVLFPGNFSGLKGDHDWLYQILHFISDLNLLAVLFFFVLSGFVIQLTSGEKGFHSQGQVSTYFRKRGKRILPLYLIALATTFLLGLVSNELSDESYSAMNFFGNLLFLQTSPSMEGSWVVPFGQNGPLWSLSFEVFFYVLFPFFTLIICRVATRSGMAGYVLSLSVLMAICLSFLGFLVRHFVFFPYAAFLTLFVVWYGGVYLAYVYKRKSSRIELILFIVTFIVLLAFSFFYSSDTVVILSKGIGIILAGFFLFQIRRKVFSGTIRSFEQGINRIFFKVGTGSYAIYALHYPVLLFVRSEFPGISLWILIPIVFIFVVLMIWLERFLVRRLSPARISYA